MEVWRKRDNPDILVEAVRLNEDNAAEVAAWSKAELIEEIDPEHVEEMQPGLNVRVAGGRIERASLGMYVAKTGVAFFVMHNRPFEMQFEPTTRPAPPLESAGDARKARGFADPFDLGRIT